MEKLLIINDFKEPFAKIVKKLLISNRAKKRREKNTQVYIPLPEHSPTITQLYRNTAWARYEKQQQLESILKKIERSPIYRFYSRISERHKNSKEREVKLMTEKMKLPYFDFYYQDFLTGTAHFTHQQKGIYITLMCHAGVRNGDGLPNNFEQLCTIVNVYSNDPEQVESLKTDINTVLHEKFKLINNKWHNERQLEDYRRTVEKINHRAEAGRKGGLAKAKQTSSFDSICI